jgi:hypothetical protein
MNGEWLGVTAPVVDLADHSKPAIHHRPFPKTKKDRIVADAVEV